MCDFHSEPLYKPEMLRVSGKHTICMHITVLTYPIKLYYNTLHLTWSPHLSKLFSPDSVILSDKGTHLCVSFLRWTQTWPSEHWNSLILAKWRELQLKTISLEVLH